MNDTSCLLYTTHVAVLFHVLRKKKLQYVSTTAQAIYTLYFSTNVQVSYFSVYSRSCALEESTDCSQRTLYPGSSWLPSRAHMVNAPTFFSPWEL